MLTKAIQSFKGYKDVVTHNGAQLSEFVLFNIRNKCIYLQKAYEIALKKMGRFDERYGEYVMNFLKVLGKTLTHLSTSASPGTLSRKIWCGNSVQEQGDIFMLAYKQLELMENEGVHNPSGDDQQILHKRIEYMVREIKSHRAALDFDKAFIMKSVTASDFEFKEEVELEGSKRKR